MTNRGRIGLAAVAALGISLLVPAEVSAQGQPPPPPPPGGGGYGPAPGPGPGAGAPVDPLWPRGGIYGGFGLGVGEMTADCQGCGDALESIGFSFDIGFRLGPRFGIFLDGWGLAHPEDNDYGTVTLVHAIATVGAQYWLSPPLWIKAGIGSAQLSVSYEGETEAESDTVAGYLIAAGYEILHSPNFSVDLELRAGSGFYDDGTIHNAALGVSVNWHSLLRRY